MFFGFAIENRRQGALDDGHDEKTSKPPSAEALEHLQCGIEKPATLCTEVRRAAQTASTESVAQQRAGKTHSHTVVTTAESALDKVDATEKNHLPKLNLMASRNILTSTDDAIKMQLKHLATPFQELEQQRVALHALLKMPKGEKKEKKAKAET